MIPDIFKPIENRDNFYFTVAIDDHTLDYLVTRMATTETFTLGLKYIDKFNSSASALNVWQVSQEERTGWELLLQQRPQRTNVTHYIKTSETSRIISNWSENGGVSCVIMATTEAEADDLVRTLEKLLPPEKLNTQELMVPFRFWSYGPDGAMMRRRKIAPLIWDQVQDNYPAEVHTKANDLFNFSPPMNRGRIILWHGPPGTGKSSAIRALSLSWLPWCNTAYIVDPERFFGNADYMLEVLLDQRTNDFVYDDPDDIFGNTEVVQDGDQRWNLLIVEDADEFLKQDAKDKTGQALSRLLNLGDGLIGQGLNFLTLITTNEPLHNIHEATSREGRCMANIEFRLFTPAEARKWLGDIEIPKDKIKENYSLATLYDIASGSGQIKVTQNEWHSGQYL